MARHNKYQTDRAVFTGNQILDECHEYWNRLKRVIRSLDAVPVDQLNAYDRTFSDLESCTRQYQWHIMRVEVAGETLPHHRDNSDLITIVIKLRTASKWDVSHTLKILIEGRMRRGSQS